MLGNLNLLFVFALALLLKLSIAHASESIAIISEEDAAVVAEVTDVIPPRGKKIGFKNKNGEMAAIVTARETYDVPSKGTRATLAPQIGTTGMFGRYKDNVSTSISVGAALDIPVSKKVSAEIEGTYTRNEMKYAMPSRGNQIHQHPFDSFSIGANGKYYFVRKVFSPYVGLGVAGICYQNLSRGALNPAGYYNEWIGTGQLMAGMDINLSQKVSIGVRGSGFVPLFSRPEVRESGGASLPGYEEAAAIDSLFYRALGTVRFAL